LDNSLSLALHQAVATTPWLATVAAALANYGVFVLPAAVVLAFLATRDRTQRTALATGVLAGAIAFGIGLVFERTLNRPRPFVALGFEPLLPHAADSSFPSDHTLVGVALVGALAFARPRLGVWLLAWAVLVGVARVVAGLHYASDIAGSAILALLFDAFVWFVLNRFVVGYVWH